MYFRMSHYKVESKSSSVARAYFYGVLGVDGSPNPVVF